MGALRTLAHLSLLAFSCQALKITDNWLSGATTSKPKKPLISMKELQSQTMLGSLIPSL